MRTAIVTSACVLLLTARAAAGFPAEDSPLWPMAYFVGTWYCVGAFPSSGRRITSTISFDTTVSLPAIIKNHDDDKINGKYHAIEVWVYDTGTKRFNAAVVDNFGGVREFESVGWDANTLVWTSAASVTPLQQFAYEKQSANRFKLDWRVARDGTNYVVGDTLTCTRFAPPK